jgi:hypothetical protein
MFRAGVNPFPGACGQNFLFCTPRHMISRAHLENGATGMEGLTLDAIGFRLSHQGFMRLND